MMGDKLEEHGQFLIGDMVEFLYTGYQQQSISPKNAKLGVPVTSKFICYLIYIQGKWTSTFHVIKG